MFQVIETLIFSFIGIVIGITGTLMVQTATTEVTARTAIDITVGVILGVVTMLIVNLGRI